jgi:hypothetical protein
MSEQNPPTQPYPPQPNDPASSAWRNLSHGYPPDGLPIPPPKPKKKHRVFLWVFLAIQILFIVWIIAGASSAGGTPSDCGTLDAETCNDAEAVGASVGVALIVIVWMVVDFLMAVIYGVYRLARRP